MGMTPRLVGIQFAPGGALKDGICSRSVSLSFFGNLAPKIIDAIKAEDSMCKRFGIIDAAAEKRRHHGPISDNLRTQS